MQVQDAIRLTLLSSFDSRLRPVNLEGRGGLLAVREASNWNKASDPLPASILLALLAIRFLHEMTLPIRNDEGSDEMALPAHFRERCLDEEAQARVFEVFSLERPLLYRCLRSCQPGFLYDFDAATDQIILELRSGPATSARFHGDGRNNRQPAFFVILGERARADMPESREDLAMKCIEYLGCGMEGVSDRLRDSWLFTAGGGLLGTVPPLGEGGTPHVSVPAATDGSSETISPEREELVGQGAREALLCAVAMCGLAAADVAARGRNTGLNEDMLLDFLAAADGATRAAIQVLARLHLVFRFRFHTACGLSRS